jgi:hypothetical protein
MAHAVTTGSSSSFATHLQSFIKFGEKFKAYPTCVNHCFIPELITLIKHKMDVFKDILNIHTNSNGSLRGAGIGNEVEMGGPDDRCKYVLSVKVNMYPMGVCSCWIIIGQIAPDDHSTE